MPQGGALLNILIRGLAFITASYKEGRNYSGTVTDRLKLICV